MCVIWTWYGRILSWRIYHPTKWQMAKHWEKQIWIKTHFSTATALQLRHNERDGVSNHRRPHCLLNCWFRCRWKKTSNLRLTGLCVGNSPVTGEFHAQKPVTPKMFPFVDVFMGFFFKKSNFPARSPAQDSNPRSPSYMPRGDLYY